MCARKAGFHRNSVPIKRVMFGRSNRTLEAQLARLVRVLATRAREGESGP